MEVRLSQSWESHTVDITGDFIRLPLDDSIEGSEEAAMQEDDDSSEKEEEEEGEEKWLVKRSRQHRGKQKGASASLSGVRAPPTPQAARAGKPYVVVCAITVYSRFVQTSLSLCAGV